MQSVRIRRFSQLSPSVLQTLYELHKSKMRNKLMPQIESGKYSPLNLDCLQNNLYVLKEPLLTIRNYMMHEEKLNQEVSGISKAINDILTFLRTNVNLEQLKHPNKMGTPQELKEAGYKILPDESLLALYEEKFEQERDKIIVFFLNMAYNNACDNGPVIDALDHDRSQLDECIFHMHEKRKSGIACSKQAITILKSWQKIIASENTPDTSKQIEAQSAELEAREAASAGAETRAQAAQAAQAANPDKKCESSLSGDEEDEDPASTIMTRAWALMAARQKAEIEEDSRNDVPESAAATYT